MNIIPPSIVYDLETFQEKAIRLCTAIEEICPKFGCHVALTGGALYKSGERKDIDILFYRIRQVNSIDKKGLFKALEQLNLVVKNDYKWCVKSKWLPENLEVDVFFPEETRVDNEYDYNESRQYLKKWIRYCIERYVV